MYKLYHDKTKRILEISPIKNNAIMLAEADNTVSEYNDCYFVSNDRSLLREKAKTLKEEWIKEKMIALKETMDIKIKNKY